MKNFSWKILLMAFVINLGLFITCSKEEEVYDPPEIIWYAPLEDERFQAGDTVMLDLLIRDDRPITNIAIRLNTASHATVLSADKISPDSNEYRVLLPFPLSDKSLNGRYYFDVRASNAVSSIPSFRYINIGAVQEKVERFFVFQSQPSQTEISEYRNDSLFSFKLFNRDLMASAYDPKSNQLFKCGRESGDFEAIGIADTSVNWGLEALQFPRPYFNGFSFTEDHCLLSLTEGRLVVFNTSGLKRYDLAFGSGFMPEFAILTSKDLLVIERTDRNSGQRYIETQYFPLGQVKQNNIFDFGDIRYLYESNPNDVIVVAEENGKQYILRYEHESGSVFDLKQFEAGQLDDVLGVDQRYIYMSVMNSPEFWRYDIVSNKLESMPENQFIYLMKYNAVDKTIVSLTSRGFEERDLDGRVIREFNSPSAAASFEMVYD